MAEQIVSQIKSLRQLQQPVQNPLDNYTIVENTIGKGTFGKVKLGMHKATQQKVAIKILEKGKIENEGDFMRIQREIHILRKIRHPNIIQLYEILESESKIYLIMEFVEGGELFNYIVQRGRLDEKESSRILQQLVNAIEYLHMMNIAHSQVSRDLKPENLLLDENNDIKVVDFGLSNLYKPGELLKTPCGSPCYAAPEMVSGLAYHGLKTDIWSSGIIFYAMLCGCVPFEDPNTKKLYEKIKKSDFARPLHLSGGAVNLLEQILVKDPEKRITIEGLRTHPFIVKSGKIPIVKGINTKNKVYTITLNEDILRGLQNFGVDLSKAKDMVQNNKHNQITTTYYLLEKMIRKSVVSIKKTKPSSSVENTSSVKSPKVYFTNDDVKQVNKTFNDISNKNQHDQIVNRSINQQMSQHESKSSRQGETLEKAKIKSMHDAGVPNYIKLLQKNRQKTQHEQENKERERSQEKSKLTKLLTEKQKPQQQSTYYTKVQQYLKSQQGDASKRMKTQEEHNYKTQEQSKKEASKSFLQNSVNQQDKYANPPSSRASTPSAGATSRSRAPTGPSTKPPSDPRNSNLFPHHPPAPPASSRTKSTLAPASASKPPPARPVPATPPSSSRPSRRTSKKSTKPGTGTSPTTPPSPTAPSPSSPTCPKPRRTTRSPTSPTPAGSPANTVTHSPSLSLPVKESTAANSIIKNEETTKSFRQNKQRGEPFKLLIPPQDL